MGMTEEKFTSEDELFEALEGRKDLDRTAVGMQFRFDEPMLLPDWVELTFEQARKHLRQHGEFAGELALLLPGGKGAMYLIPHLLPPERHKELRAMIKDRVRAHNAIAYGVVSDAYMATIHSIHERAALPRVFADAPFPGRREAMLFQYESTSTPPTMIAHPYERIGQFIRWDKQREQSPTLTDSRFAGALYKAGR